MVKFLLLLPIIILSISAEASSWPKWVYQTDCKVGYFCAVGIAENESIAKKYAFDDLSQQLQTKINSSSSILVTKKDNKNNTVFSKNINITTDSIPLNLVSVVKKTTNDGQIALLITLSKSQYYSNLTSHLITFFNNISTITQLNLQPSWQQRVWALRQTVLQSKIENKLILLSSLDNEKTISSGMWNKFKQWQNITSYFKNKAIIEVQAPNHLTLISSTISNNFLGGAGPIYWLQPSIKSRTAKKGGEYITEAVLSIELLESEAPYRVLFTNSLKQQSRALSKTLAKQKAIEAIAQLINSSKGQILFDKDSH